MDTTWRNTTVKSSSPLALSALLAFGIGALLQAMPASAQSTGATSSTAGIGMTLLAPSAGSGASLGKSGLAAGGLVPSAIPRDFAQLRIEPGDLLNVNVYDTPELSSAYRVDSQGNLTLPLCGKVKLQGLTPVDASKLIETTLVDDQILNHPQVNVDVQQYAGEYVTVLGEVALPGRVTTIAPTKLSDILAQAGGLNSIAGTRILIRHGEDEAAPELDVPFSRSDSNQQAAGILVRPGDTVTVPRAGIVYVLGAVARPGGYLMQEDGKLNVAEALAMGGGTLPQAQTHGLRVIRRNPDGTVLDFALSYDGIASGKQTPLQLQAQDIVYVPMSKLKSTLSDATGIISAATSAALYTTR